MLLIKEADRTLLHLPSRASFKFVEFQVCFFCYSFTIFTVVWNQHITINLISIQCCLVKLTFFISKETCMFDISLKKWVLTDFI